MAKWSPDTAADSSSGADVLSKVGRSAEPVIEILACGAVRRGLCQWNA